MKYGALVRWTLVILSGITASMVTAERVAAEEVYTATLTSPKGLADQKTAELTITFDERTSDEQAARFVEILQEQGNEAAFEALAKNEIGRADVKNGRSATINLVRVFPGENGSRVIIITNEPLYFPEDIPRPSAEPSVGLIELVVATTGRGRGTLAEALGIKVTGEGMFRVTAARRDPIDLEDVQRVR